MYEKHFAGVKRKHHFGTFSMVACGRKKYQIIPGAFLVILYPQGVPSSLLLDPDFGIHLHKVKVVAGPAPPVLLLAPVERPVWGLVPSEVRRQV